MDGWMIRYESETICFNINLVIHVEDRNTKITRVHPYICELMMWSLFLLVYTGMNQVKCCGVSA